MCVQSHVHLIGISLFIRFSVKNEVLTWVVKTYIHRIYHIFSQTSNDRDFSQETVLLKTFLDPAVQRHTLCPL